MTRNTATLDASSREFRLGAVEQGFGDAGAGRGAFPLRDVGRPRRIAPEIGQVGTGAPRADEKSQPPASRPVAEAGGALKPRATCGVAARTPGLTPDPPDAPDLLRQQLLKQEQSIVIGRLTAHVCHAINNSLQAVRGALTLALEEADIPPAVVEYLRLCQVEAQREARMVDRLREVYRPPSEPQLVDLKALLDDVVALTSDEAERLGVEIHQDAGSHLPPLQATDAQLRLVFLSIVLRLIDLAAMTGRGILHLRSFRQGACIRVEASIDGMSPGAGATAVSPAIAEEILESQLESLAVSDVVRAQGGAIGRVLDRRNVGVWVTLQV